MKKVLITGAGSYIGTSIEKWLCRKPEDYEVTVLDMVKESWRQFDFTGYDTVCHVAGIAHRKDASAGLYEKVNHILAVETAKKARGAGVKQFIFMSSGAVYGQSDRHHREIVVDEDSKLMPSTPYGTSKMKAEKGLMELASLGGMKLAILRPPMVYGPGAKGNFNALSKLARKTPVFPKIKNQRSMIYIDNLCEFIKLVIDSETEGVFLPQNKEYVNSSDMVEIIAKAYGRRVVLTPVFNWMVFLLSRKLDMVNKVFGTYIYKPQKAYFNNKYCICDFPESIDRTEKRVLQVQGHGYIK